MAANISINLDSVVTRSVAEPESVIGLCVDSRLSDRQLLVGFDGE
ncbi:hypothetical Protein YC6258_00858 [Gynuella sunshinyii YC6258]|uniref:Uncharacterized protein n=1 Tax=Gynuella sunshinyii YC6258 TaxID=1445510 RepID=A0A0C5VHS3_9GAMM|nr:hypothetical Protein YC6258_00858 [Gynuella sunshinyii YC6258]